MHFVEWQDALQYLASKKKLVRKLSMVENAKRGAWLLSTQCCHLAQIIWSRNRFLINQDELVELLVQHAELCIDMVKYFQLFFLSFSLQIIFVICQ